MQDWVGKFRWKKYLKSPDQNARNPGSKGKSMKNHNSWIGILLILTSFIPDIGVKYSTFGFNWTLYRTTVFLLLAGYLWTHKGLIRLYRYNYFCKWILFLLLWIADGTLLMIFSRYSDYHRGFLELLSLFNGMVVILVMSSICRDRAVFERMIKMLLVLMNAFILIGYVEILTGFHLPTSMFRDSHNSASLYGYHAHMATGHCYNINDFSALLTIMLPSILLLQKKHKWLAVFDIVSIIIINIVNDANICLIAIFTGICFAILLISRKHSRRILVVLGLGIVVAAFCMLVAIHVHQKSYNSSFLFVRNISMQVLNFNNSTGSMYVRLNTYWIGMVAVSKSGFLGWGPSSFTNYFTRNTSALYSLEHSLNPHCYLLEIAFQYGLLIVCTFLFLVTSFIKQAVRMYKRQLPEDKLKYLMVSEFLIIYLIASFAPSAYIGYSYQWAILGLCCCVLQKKDIKKVLIYDS